MKRPVKIAECMNFEIEIQLTDMKRFISNFIEKKFSLQWIHEHSDIYLLIENLDSLYKIPFYRTERSAILSMRSLPVYHKDLLYCLEKSLSEFKGEGSIFSFGENRVYQSNYLKGELSSYLELDNDGNIISETSLISSKETEKRVLKMEIDYVLMELYDYMTENDDSGKESSILKLKELTTKLSKLDVEIS